MSMTAKTRRLGYISDHETKVDLLRNEAIAETVIKIIMNGDDRPMTIGVHGYWGAGKSSVLEMIAAKLPDQGDGTLVIRYNGWQFQGFEDAKIALIEGIVHDLIENRSLMTKAGEQVRNILKRIDWLKVAKRTGGLAFNLVTGMPSPDQISDIVSFVGSKIGSPSDLLTKENAEAVADEAKEYWKEKGESPSVPAEIRAFRAAFSDLMKAAEVTRLVVLVDDLDRCLPETAIETLEAIRLFVMLPKTAFVIGADENMIKYAVTKHFPNLPEGEVAAEYPRAYLEKLIQIPFRIPAMGDAETRTYLTLLVVGALVGEESPGFLALLKVATNYMSKPWEQKSVSETDVKTALGAVYDEEIKRSVIMVSRIAPVLASGTNGNPRHVKRFVNALNLRLQVAEARGFGDAIDQAVLAKIMLAEQFLPEAMFTQVAREAGTAADGCSPSLAALEKEVLGQGIASDEDGVDPKVAANVSADVLQWAADTKIRRWTEVLPSLAEVPLKPYLFVINDVKNHTTSAALLDPHLLEIVSKLTGGSFAARSASKDLKELGPGDAIKVFDELRMRLLALPDLTKKPDLIDGIAAFVETLPAFETKYLDLLDELPTSKLAGWVVGGHDKAVRSPTGQSRLAAIVQKWSQSSNPKLKGFAVASSKIKRDR
ncbi:Qat anti-phage system ATPase QatA [Sinorhizobium meliloti]|uniref:Qat anti-phage system ATPase QatA n=1 Tax=Rhizobium meliloti TaxID=382 RepID=UPI000B49B734|nr:Qat anti-phage system ATPase QatA [Sinorhizobium meliloti]ASP68623.1 hypothetical protein CDO29_29925 [Sinorhizobium meliloti]MQX04583.1 NTPase KAP [Sinorhizobium meliloti]RVE98898.1 NTPase KAP [Sinorhizobium meliloti]RVK40140.1 NTPase KAP [Sinorhizobium meliloti]